MLNGKLPRALLAAVLFLCSLLTGAAAWAQLAVPALQARVTDLTRTLSAGELAALDQKLAAFEQRKGSQIAVLLVPGTQPESIEQYAIRVAENWKLGRKGVDDGALLLVAKNDRALRIEVGRGLEGVLPDAVAKRIVSDTIVPLFKQNDFYGGINAGIERMMRVIDGEPLPPPRSASRGATDRFDFGGALVWGAMLVIFVGGILRAIFGRFLGSAVTGGVAGWAAFALGAGLAGGAILGVIVFVLSLIGLTSPGRGGGWTNRGGGWGGGGWRSGGGGWSGGGGDFGGGGASGRW